MLALRDTYFVVNEHVISGNRMKYYECSVKCNLPVSVSETNSSFHKVLNTGC